ARCLRGVACGEQVPDAAEGRGRTMTTTKTGADGPEGSGSGLLPPGWARFTGVLLILLSLLPAAGCAAAFAWCLPYDRARYQDYRAAEACSARELEQGTTDCLSTSPFTVVKTEDRARSNEAFLMGEDSWQRRVSFGDERPLFEQLNAGDRVTATVWRRDIVVLSKDGVRQNTSDAPRDELQANAGLGIVGGLVAAQSFIFGAVRLVRPRGYKPFSWNPFGKWLLLTIFATFFVVAVPAVWLRTPWQAVPPASVAVTVCAAILMNLGLRRRAADGI
ncbi:hypothetical protein ACFQ07_24860, partial [Actinomadura adrarensis]